MSDDVLNALNQGAAGKYQPSGGGAPPSFPMVAPHATPDGSGAMTNLSDADYAKFMGGQQGPQAASAPAATEQPKWQEQQAPQEADPVLMALKQGQHGQFTAPPPPEQPGGNMVGQLLHGAKEGVMSMANVGMQEPRMLGEAGTKFFNWMTGRNVQNPVPSFDAGDYAAPNGFRESAARAIGQGLPMLPLMAAGAAMEAPTLGGAAVAAGKSMLQNALPVAAGQVGGEAAAEFVPPQYQDAARFAGSMATGGVAGLGQAAAEGATRGAAHAASFMGIAPKQDFGGVRATGQQLQSARSKLESAANQSGPDGAERFQGLLENAPQEIVPGSQPTTAQVAPLPGIAKLEDTIKSGEAGPAFMKRAEQQNTARVNAIQGLSNNADPAAVGQFFRQRLADMDAAGQQQIGSAKGAVQGQTEALGGQGAPAAYGSEMRGQIQGALDPVQTQRRALWNAVDPDGSLALDTTPVSKVAKQLGAELTPSDTLTAQENGVLKHAAQMSGVQKFSDLQTLRSNILDAQRRTGAGEPLSTKGMKRLNDLKAAVDGALAAAVEQRAGQEAHAVSSGAMTPEQTMIARLEAEAQAHLAAKRAATGEATARGDLGSRPGSDGGSGSSRVSGSNRAEVPPTGRSGNSAGNQGVQGKASPLEPNFDEEAAARYAAAREATLREKERFGRGPVGEVLARGSGGAPNRVLDADVPSKFFTGRPSEPERVQAYIKAVGGAPKATALARDYLVSDLRKRNIINPDGTLDATKFAGWQQQRAETTKLFPGLSKDFASAEAAQRALDDVEAAHAAALKEYQTGAAKHFLGEEPARAVEKTLNSSDRVKLMNDAIGKVKANPDALASLQDHVVNYIINKLTSSAKASEANAANPNITDVGALRPDAFQEWVRTNNPWLKRLFGGQGRQNVEMVGQRVLENVGKDLKRQQLRTQATAGSQTVERGAAANRHGLISHSAPTIMALIGEKIAETGAAAAGMHGVPGLIAEAAGAALPVLIHTLRQHGIQTRNDLVRVAMLHPALAKELMQRPKQMKISDLMQRRIAGALTATTAAAATTEEVHQ